MGGDAPASCKKKEPLHCCYGRVQLARARNGKDTGSRSCLIPGFLSGRDGGKDYVNSTGYRCGNNKHTHTLETRDLCVIFALSLH